MTGRFEPILGVIAFVIFWFLFHIIFLCYNFLVVTCGYYSDFWLSSESFWLSPLSAFTLCILLFATYFCCKASEAFRKSRKNIFIWLVALSLPITSLFGVNELYRFIQFQHSSTPISEFYNLDELPSWHQFSYKMLSEDYPREKDRLIRSGRYCEAMDFYKRTQPSKE